MSKGIGEMSVTLSSNGHAVCNNNEFDELVAYCYVPIWRYLVRRTGDGEFAADLAQETFLDAYRYLPRLPSDRSRPAWLFRIARNNLRAARRTSARRRQVSLDLLLDRGAPPSRARAGRPGACTISATAS